MINCPIAELKLGLALLFFLPLSFYFLPAASLAGGHGFVCQIGCGPISPLGYTISLIVWTALAAVLAAAQIKLRNQWKHRKANKFLDPIAEPARDARGSSKGSE
jgi:hypothetical protein